MMREVTRSIGREARAWGIALALILAYLGGGYGAECWPGVMDWLAQHGFPR